MFEDNRYPDRITAEQILKAAYDVNPGTWVDHCHNVARAAAIIAEHSNMNEEKAYSIGLLHDIGRGEYKGWNMMHHVIAGYEMMKRDYPDVARVCLTHSFVTKDIREYGDGNNLLCTEEEQLFIQKYLNGIEYNDYDLLIQLCDSICLPEAITVIEKRIVDVTIRYGQNGLDVERWKGLFNIKQHFDDLCGCNIYQFFRDEIETSIFG